MQLINVQIIIVLYIFIKVNSIKEINLFRFLSESNPNNSSDKINSSEPINSTEMMDSENSTISCYNFTDCFNCTLIPTCRWIWDEESCIDFEPYNENYSLPILNNSIVNNISTINKHINFLRNVCYMPVIPYIDNNNNSFLYDKTSVQYCGPHYIKISDHNLISNNFKIEINNINGVYGVPNLICEYIFLSGPNHFDINIQLNEKEINNYYLLYSQDSYNFIQNINSSTSLSIEINGKKLNTFIFYGLKSFGSSPFIITYKEENIIKKASQATGYIMVALYGVIIPIIIIAIIYMRKKSIIFKKEKEENITFEEKEKIKIANKYRSEENVLKDKNIKDQTSKFPAFISNFSPPITKTPQHLLNEQAFVFDNICCVDDKIINNNENKYTAKCGHKYHMSCFNKLLEKSQNGKIKCVSCNEIIYP